MFIWSGSFHLFLLRLIDALSFCRLCWHSTLTFYVLVACYRFPRDVFRDFIVIEMCMHVYALFWKCHENALFHLIGHERRAFAIKMHFCAVLPWLVSEFDAAPFYLLRCYGMMMQTPFKGLQNSFETRILCSGVQFTQTIFFSFAN